jgi:hypothetical protein
MQTQTSENTIFSQVQHLSDYQKEALLKFVANMNKPRHSTRLYKSKALKQIRKALSNPI